MTDLNSLNAFKLSVKRNDESTRKIVCEQADWGDLSDQIYYVDIQRINRLSGAVRISLARFVKQCMDPNAGGVHKSGKHLKELAEHGRRLYTALFLNARGDSAPADFIRGRIREAAGSYRMNVNVDDRTYVPWGLVYDGDPSRLSGDPEDVSIEHYADFWCLKYLVSCTYATARIRALAATKELSDYRLISALHRDVFTSAESLIAPGEPEARVLGWLRDHFSGTRAFNSVYSKNELYESWRTNADLDMLFFYCHADPTSIALSATDEMLNIDDISVFRADLRQEKGPPPPTSSCLFFMNGCSTAVGAEGGGFLEVSGRDGACGFIGTETEVPDLFALRFGLAFLYYFLSQGLPIYQVMDKLRRAHWPLSLVYSTYCPPVLRVKPPPDAPVAGVEFDNFSYKRLGTTESATI